MESLKTVFRLLKPGEQARSQTQAVTKSDCDVCGGAAWLLLPGKDHEGFPLWRACDACPEGYPNFLRGLGFADNERIEPLKEFDANRQAERRAREAATLALQKVREWIRGDLVNLTISGPIGVGKTHLAKAAVYHLGQAGLQPLYVSAPVFERRCKNFDLPGDVRERYMATLIERAHMAFDDIGFGGKDESPYMRGQIEGLIDGRYRRGNRTMLTTNLLRDELAAYAGVRVVDRLMQDGAWVSMPGMSLR